MEPDFNFNKFLHRKNFKQKDAAAAVGASMGLIGTWAAKKAVPSYEKMAKLIDVGITAQELFGEELGSKLIENSSVSSVEGLSPEMQELLKHPDFVAGMKKAFSEIESKKKDCK